MKITFCIDSLSKGGAERVLVNLANYFAKSKTNKINILTLRKDNNIAYMLNNNVELISLNINTGKKNAFQKIHNLILNLKTYKKYIKKNNPDIIISFLPRASYYSAIIACITKTKLIISERNNPNSIYANKIKKFITTHLYKKANMLIFQTNMAKNFFCKKIQKKAVVIPNPVSEEFFNKCYNGKRNKNIVNVGRLTEQKNQKLLIDAFYDFSKRHNDYNLIIYGEGPLRTELEEYIKSLNLETLVKLPGIIDNIADKIVDSSMFVFTSNYEGMPNALMEAMTLGIPCISTDCPCGGPREIIDNGINGFLVPVGEKNEIVSKMEEIIMDDVSQKFSINAVEKMQLYKNDLINEKWKNYIEKILKG